MANYCSACGKPLKPGQRFCIGCGAPVPGLVEPTSTTHNFGEIDASRQPSADGVIVEPESPMPSDVNVPAQSADSGPSGEVAVSLVESMPQDPAFDDSQKTASIHVVDETEQFDALPTESPSKDSAAAAGENKPDGGQKGNGKGSSKAIIAVIIAAAAVIILVILFATGALGIKGGNKADVAFQKFVGSLDDKSCEYIEYDVDGDGTKELVVVTDSEGKKTVSIYGYDGEVRHHGSFDGDKNGHLVRFDKSRRLGWDDGSASVCVFFLIDQSVQIQQQTYEDGDKQEVYLSRPSGRADDPQNTENKDTQNISNATPKNTEKSQTGQYTAYANKCKEYVVAYGEPGFLKCGSNEEYASGLCYANLLDMNGDGEEELLIVFGDSREGKVPPAFTVEVWSYRNGSIQKDYSGGVSPHGTNGYFPFLEVFKCSQGGYAIQVRDCNGSNPAKFDFKLYGFPAEGGSKLLTERSYQEPEGPKQQPIYYSGEYATKVSESDYQKLFGSFLDDQNNPVVHAHLYRMGYDASSMCDLSSKASGLRELSDVISGTQAVLKQLDEKAKAESSESTKQESAPDSKSAVKAQYRTALLNLINDQVLPTGDSVEYTDDGFSESKFAIGDVDSDGKDELVIRWESCYMAGMLGGVYEYDSKLSKWLTEFEGTPQMNFHEDGWMTNDALHFQAGGTVWPYGVHRYSEKDGAYVEVAYMCESDGTTAKIRRGSNTSMESYESFLANTYGASKQINLDWLPLTTQNIESACAS